MIIDILLIIMAVLWLLTIGYIVSRRLTRFDGYLDVVEQPDGGDPDLLLEIDDLSIVNKKEVVLRIRKSGRFKLQAEPGIYKEPQDIKSLHQSSITTKYFDGYTFSRNDSQDSQAI